MQKLSISGKDYHTEEHVTGCYNTGDRIQFWGTRGAFWGILFGSASFFIPGIGPIVAFGPLVGWLVGALEGAVVGGLSALGAGLYPKESVLEYEMALKVEQLLVIAHGTADDVTTAKRLVEASGATHVVIFSRGIDPSPSPDLNDLNPQALSTFPMA